MINKNENGVGKEKKFNPLILNQNKKNNFLALRGAILS